MVKSPGEDLIKGLLSRMAEWGMAQIVTQRDGFGQIFIKAEGLGDRPGNLGDFKGMGQSCVVMVSGRSEKDLRLMFQPPEGFGMDDSVPVVLKGWPERTLLFKGWPPFAHRTQCRKR